MTTGRYRKRPVVIEAMCWDEATDGSAIIDWVLAGGGTARHHCWPVLRGRGPQPYADLDRLAIETLEGTMFASPGDWIIKGVKGEFYPCKPEIFNETYEEVSS